MLRFDLIKEKFLMLVNMNSVKINIHVKEENELASYPRVTRAWARKRKIRACIRKIPLQLVRYGLIFFRFAIKNEKLWCSIKGKYWSWASK